MALYVGLVTDTGKFMYENTDARSHRMAAALIDAGVDVNETYRRLYEHVPIEKLKLVARALQKIEVHDDGVLAITYISAADYEATGASEVLTEGIIDQLRTLDGTLGGGRGPRPARTGPRPPQGEPALDRRPRGRLGDRREAGRGRTSRAAGFRTDLAYDEVIEFLRAQVGAQL